MKELTNDEKTEALEALTGHVFRRYGSGEFDLEETYDPHMSAVCIVCNEQSPCILCADDPEELAWDMGPCGEVDPPQVLQKGAGVRFATWGLGVVIDPDVDSLGRIGVHFYEGRDMPHEIRVEPEKLEVIWPWARHG